MEPFATIEDLEADGRTLEGEGVTTEAAETLLGRVSAYIATLLMKHGIEVDPQDELQAANLATVTCYVVWDEISKRKSPDYSSLSQSVGSTSVSLSMRERPTGFFIPNEYKALLGISGRGGFKVLRPAIRNPDGTPVEGW